MVKFALLQLLCGSVDACLLLTQLRLQRLLLLLQAVILLLLLLSLSALAFQLWPH